MAIKYVCDNCQKETKDREKSTPMGWSRLNFGNGRVYHACSEDCRFAISRLNIRDTIKRDLEDLRQILMEQQNETDPEKAPRTTLLLDILRRQFLITTQLFQMVEGSP